MRFWQDSKHDLECGTNGPVHEDFPPYEFQTVNMAPKRRAKSNSKPHVAMPDFRAEESQGLSNDFDLSSRSRATKSAN